MPVKLHHYPQYRHVISLQHLQRMLVATRHVASLGEIAYSKSTIIFFQWVLRQFFQLVKNYRK